MIKKFRIVLLINILLVLVFSYKSFAVYSNATLTGPWILRPSSDYSVYFVFDGNGNITDAGVISDSAFVGSYSVQTDGSFTFSGDDPLTGQLTSETTGTWNYDSNDSAVMVKVSDPSVCQGSWRGSLKEIYDGDAFYPVTFDVDSNGVITSFTGFTGPVTGRMYSE